MKYLTTILTTIIYVLTYQYVFSTNELPSVIDKDTVLTKEHSPYYVLSGLTINDGATLTINAGTVIMIAPGVSIIVRGNIYSNGNAEEPVIFKSKESVKWESISATDANLTFNYTNFDNARRVLNSTNGEKIVFSHCKVTNTFGGIGYDCIGIHYVKKVIIEFCELYGDPLYKRIDAIDADGIDSCIIRHNRIMNFEDDGVDIGTGTKLASIYYNYIENCNYGVSVGENSTSMVYRNIIIKCYGGVQSHGGSNVTIENNTFYSNTVGVECHHHGDANSKGSADVLNTIFSQSLNADYSLQDSLSFKVSYSLSDQFILPGDSNYLSDPMFVNPDSGVFYLLPESPCIDAGSPLSPKDTNGQNIDIGFYEYYGPIKDSTDLPPNDTTDKPDIPDSTNYICGYYSNQTFNLWPNPCNEFTVVQHNLKFGNEQYRVGIYNLNGRLTFEKEIQIEDLRLNMIDIPSGLYIVVIFKNRLPVSRAKLIKK